MNDTLENTIEKNAPRIRWKRLLRPVLCLLILIAVVTLGLHLVNDLTEGRIAGRAAEQRRAAMASVMPEANIFSELFCDDTTIDGIAGAYSGTRFLGYCVEVSSNGFSGAVRLMVGVSESGRVTGVAILEHSESSTLGARAESSDFLAQYIGKSGTIRVNNGKNAIDGVTHATITSQAITDGVNAALTAVLHYDAEGGQFAYEDDV